MARNSWFDRQFPHFPRSVQEAYLRLAPLGFGLVVFLLGVIPKHHIALLEALWLQLGAAALLWFEANASCVGIKLVIAEFHQPFHPTTLAERAWGWGSRCIIWLMWLLGYASVALTLAKQVKPHWLVYDELIWAGVFFPVAACIFLIARLVDRSQANLRKSMMNGLASEEESKVRRFLRTVAFVLLFLGTLGQLIEVALF